MERSTFIHECAKHRGIKLMAQMMKCFERIMDTRMRPVVEPQLKEERFRFRKGSGTVDAMFVLR